MGRSTHVPEKVNSYRATLDVLAAPPKVMLFDESMLALDPEMIQEVLNVMKRVAKDQRYLYDRRHSRDGTCPGRDRLGHLLPVEDSVQVEEPMLGEAILREEPERCPSAAVGRLA